MGGYHHLSYAERIKIEALLKINVKIEVIAKEIGFSPSTIYREVKRGEYERLDGRTYKTYKAYSADIAQQKYDFNKTAKGRDIKIGNDKKLSDYIENRIIKYKESPDVVSNRIREKGFTTTICTNTIYNYIEKGIFLNLTNNDLWEKSKRITKKQNNIKRIHKRNLQNRSIDERPADVMERLTFGHWELDTVLGSRRSVSCLLVFSERLSRYVIILKCGGKTSAAVKHHIDNLEKKYINFKEIFKSITMDNGSEFINQDNIECSFKNNDLRTISYYCHPYSAFERGTNENTNRMIRRFIPKGANIDDYSKNDIQFVENWINSYPRKILNYRTAKQVFDKCISSVNNL